MGSVVDMTVLSYCSAIKETLHRETPEELNEQSDGRFSFMQVVFL